MNLDSCVLIAFLKGGKLQVRYAPVQGYQYPGQLGPMLAECAQKMALEHRDRHGALREIQRYLNEAIEKTEARPAPARRATPAKPRAQWIGEEPK